jgi:hypothetical protein
MKKMLLMVVAVFAAFTSCRQEASVDYEYTRSARQAADRAQVVCVGTLTAVETTPYEKTFGSETKGFRREFIRVTAAVEEVLKGSTEGETVFELPSRYAAWVGVGDRCLLFSVPEREDGGVIDSGSIDHNPYWAVKILPDDTLENPDLEKLSQLYKVRSPNPKTLEEMRGIVEEGFFTTLFKRQNNTTIADSFTAEDAATVRDFFAIPDDIAMTLRHLQTDNFHRPFLLLYTEINHITPTTFENAMKQTYQKTDALDDDLAGYAFDVDSAKQIGMYRNCGDRHQSAVLFEKDDELICVFCALDQLSYTMDQFVQRQLMK